jgi:hypothetical protein
MSSVITSKSTATQAQIDKLIELLALAPRHTHELRRLGISHPAGRIQDLEAMGFVIDVGRVTTVDENSFTHKGVARYSLISRPEAGQQIQIPLGLRRTKDRGTVLAASPADAGGSHG